jgi:ectoine hydroxylase-related dioxygenase (phytanoyl-CoA dioxygenase family)
MAHLTCWIALDDASAENGCLHYIPGSHNWDLLPITGLADGMEAIEGVLSPAQREAFENAVPMELAAGECVFHHPLAIHGSFANSSARGRRATVINVFADGVKSACDETLLRGVPTIPAGGKMEGQFFPLLFNPVAEQDANCV